MGTCFSTTDWHLKDGQEEAFADHWTAFLEWTRETQQGFESARLVADDTDSHHFLSVGGIAGTRRPGKLGRTSQGSWNCLSLAESCATTCRGASTRSRLSRTSDPNATWKSMVGNSVIGARWLGRKEL